MEKIGSEANTVLHEITARALIFRSSEKSGYYLGERDILFRGRTFQLTVENPSWRKKTDMSDFFGPIGFFFCNRYRKTDFLPESVDILS